MSNVWMGGERSIFRTRQDLIRTKIIKIVRAIAEMTMVHIGTVAVIAVGNMAIMLIIHKNNRKGGNQISINCEPLKSHCAGLVS